jgi:polyferredoxin
MNYLWRAICGGLTVTMLLGVLAPAAAELIPTPDFSDHPIPATTVTSPPGGWWSTIDMAMLLIALALATYLALVTRSRWQLLALTAASLVYFGFVRGGCVCPIGAVQNVALALGNTDYVVPVSVVVFFALPLIFTLFFGRTFCAAVCPLGAIQELVAVRTVQVPSWLNQALGLVPFFYLGAAVILAATHTAFVICRFDPFVAMFRLSGSTAMLIFGGLLLLAGVFIGRPYCRYLCPYGAILRLLSPLSKWHVRIPPTSCIQCRLCEDACPYGAIETPTQPLTAGERRFGRRWLLGTLAATPLLALGGSVGGKWLAEPLAAWHPQVQLARDLHHAERPGAEGVGAATTGTQAVPAGRQVTAGNVTAAVEAFRSTGGVPAEAYEAAADWIERFRSLGTWLGAWVGLVLGLKLVQLSLRRRRTEFQPNPAGCVSCGRCFWYCPVEQVRLGLIGDVSEAVPEKAA